ncbi:LysM peptidoglycan-binding domain-containing protein [Sporolactobacillus spathodeae]|uniref:Stage VI sporulation protein D n=1 Tax=Sporolactobacillus spathodeae TaxID=1465502 RepID=A0ABS2Q788_9BACL|nr:LysM peptidoglycan-binding domain-containing protein [Sporolactobacillus spathodeae]MBM7657461.1 stage VI sporulation protein D [Sporolactobacillus spathodeae]
MSQSSNDRLQFSINESVWLRDDAPAEEILSMALEPDITVEESWNDVTIKGFLRLTGEYKPAPYDGQGTESGTAPFRTIDEIMETNNGTAILEHRFPIDITIPADRVPNLEELFVIIEAFDYELSEHRHLQLQADLAITGLNQPKPIETARTEAPTVPTPAPTPMPAPAPVAPQTAAPVSQEKNPVANKSAEAATKKEAANKEEKLAVEKAQPQAKAKAAETSKKENAVSPEKGAVSAAAKQFTKPVEKSVPKTSGQTTEATGSSPEQPKASKASMLKKKARDFGDIPFETSFEEMPTDSLDYEADEATTAFAYEAFRKPDMSEAPDDQPSVAFAGRSEDATERASEAPQLPQTPRVAPAPVAQEIEAEALNEKAEPEQTGDTNSLYLTKVLAGAETEQKTMVRIYIVQGGDSLESISNRYKVPVTSLMKKNQLPTGALEAGELLFIPITKAVQDV